jgi:Concanavalin A-like lectin/glucanases superfamily/Secretion system C-terminal sorting domain
MFKHLLCITLSLFFLCQSNIAQQTQAGEALQFEGTNNINYGNVDFGFEDEFTIMFWCRWDTTPSDGSRWANLVTINSNSHGDNGQLWIQHNSDNSKFEYALATESNGSVSRSYLQSTTSPLEGEWNHIAAVFGGDSMKLYVNGIKETGKQKSGNVIPSIAEYELTIASWACSNNDYRRFNGTIDEVSIWTKALSTQEINIYKNMLLCTTMSGLAAYWRFDNIADTIVYDYSPNGVNGILESSGNGFASNISSNAPLYGNLPIDLLYFNTICDQDSVVILNWATASETNNDYFTLSRSTNGNDWEIINRIQGAGNSNEVKTYKYKDRSISGEETTYYYILRQTDYNGEFEDFDIKAIYCRQNKQQLKLYPNPVSYSLNLEFKNPYEESTAVLILIYNSSGQLIMTKDILSEKGLNRQTIELPSLQKGTYYFHLKMGKYYLSKPIIVSQ